VPFSFWKEYPRFSACGTLSALMRKAIFALAVVLAGTSVWLVIRGRTRQHTVRVFFHNAQGLQRRAKVRANGLDVGIVKDVDLSSQLGRQPVEMVLKLNSRYAARIPNDSIAMIETEGILGPPHVEIDVSKATGPPVSNNGVLMGVDTGGSTAVFQGFLSALTQESTKSADQAEKMRQTMDSQYSRTKK